MAIPKPKKKWKITKKKWKRICSSEILSI